MTSVATWRALLVPYAARKIPVVGAALMVIAALSDFPELEMVAPANKLGQMMVQLARTFVAQILTPGLLCARRKIQHAEVPTPRSAKSLGPRTAVDARRFGQLKAYSATISVAILVVPMLVAIYASKKMTLVELQIGAGA